MHGVCPAPEFERDCEVALRLVAYHNERDHKHGQSTKDRAERIERRERHYRH